MPLVLIILFLVNISYAQEIIRENIGSGGASKTINNIHFNQSIGQQSAVNGTVSNNDITLRQGFQQPVFRVEKNNLTDITELDLVIYPNPFRYDIGVKFDQEPTEKIYVLVFDSRGRLIKKLDFDPLIEITIPCKELSTGSYLLNIKTANKQYSANIIKQ
tara:strand:- start:1231 stop:1710 length:480 start_codon:yes stop_codon:yes gene_type:complete